MLRIALLGIIFFGMRMFGAEGDLAQATPQTPQTNTPQPQSVQTPQDQIPQVAQTTPPAQQPQPLKKGQRDPNISFPPNAQAPKVTKDIAPTYADNFKLEKFQAQPTLNAAIDLAKKGKMKQALQLFKQSCNEGNPAGCFGSGLMYMYGQGTINNQEKAVAYFFEACAGGDGVACTNLAIAYDEGMGVQIDKEKALQYFLVGCEGGDSTGCNNAGWMYAMV